MLSRRDATESSTATSSRRGARSWSWPRPSTGSTARRRGTANIPTAAGPAPPGLEALLEPGPGRAETVQRIFSLEYDPAWREHMDVPRAAIEPIR